MQVSVEGRLDFSAAVEFQQQLEHALEQALAGAGASSPAVIVDCAALGYVSSAGLRAFLLAAKSAQRLAITFALCALQPAVREVFELSGFSRIMPVHADRASALAQAHQSGA